MGQRLALIIATYRYEDAGLRQLTAPAHDAEAFAAVLQDPDIAGFEVTTLINPSRDRVGRALGELYRDRRREDLTLLYFTGHGLKDDSGHLYLAMADTLRDNLLFTGISAEHIDRAIESSPSRRKVLILDCCYSGAYPAGRIAKADNTVHALEQFSGRGRTVLTASDATQYSFEGDQLSGAAIQSVFTRHLVAGLRDGSADLDNDGDITLDELYAYVYERVVAELPQQRPKRQDNVEGRTVIARNINWTLPSYLRNAIHSPLAADRLAALDGLAHLRRIGNDLVRRRVEEKLHRLSADDSKLVSATAAKLLATDPAEPHPVPVPDPPPTIPPNPLAPPPHLSIQLPAFATDESSAAETGAAHTPDTPAGHTALNDTASANAQESSPAPDAEPRPATAAVRPFTASPVPTPSDTSDRESSPKTTEPVVAQPSTPPQPAGDTESDPNQSNWPAASAVRVYPPLPDPDDDIWDDWDNPRPRGTRWLREGPSWVRQLVRRNKAKTLGAVVVVLLVVALAVYLMTRDKGGNTGYSVIGTLTGFPNDVHSIAFSPMRDLVAASSTGSAGDTTRLCKVADEVPCLGEFAGRDPVFSPGGAYLALSSASEFVLLVDTSTLQETRLPGHRGDVQKVFSNDGGLLVTASSRFVPEGYDNPLHLWEVPSGRLIQDLPGHTNGIQSLTLSRDGIKMVSADTPGSVRVWDFPARSTKLILPTGNHFVLSPGSDIVASSGWENPTAVVLTLLNGQYLGPLEANATDQAYPVSFSADGAILATTGRGDKDTFWLWNTATREQITMRRDGYPWAFADTTLLLTSTGKDAKLFDAKADTYRLTITGHTGRITAAATRDGGIIATGSTDGTVRILRFSV